MALIEWSAEWELGIKEIDGEHRKLVGLNDAMAQGRGRDVVGKTIDGLIAYTKTHFLREENYFNAFGYTDAAAHKAEHKKFILKVTQARTDYAAGNKGLSTDLLFFLRDWLKSHIHQSDRKYLTLFAQRGVK